MTIALRPADEITWRKIDDLVPDGIRDRLDPGERASYLAFHETGGADAPQLLEIRLQPDAFVVPHGHDTDEVFYVLDGELRWGDRILGRGGSAYVPARSVYSFRAGPAGAAVLNFRPKPDHSFHLKGAPAGKAGQDARVRDQFTQQAEGYARLLNAAGQKDRGPDPLLETAQPAADDRVLDVGCGAGHRAVALARVAAEVVGVDLTPAMLDQARKLQAQAGLANITWTQADAADLPFADGAFTLVLSQAMFHHAADPRAALAEMRRVCRPGGRIAVTDLTPPPRASAAFDAIELLRDPSHAHALTLDELRALGADLGLQEVAVRPQAADMPIEPVLAASSPPPGMLGRLRELYARDAVCGADSLGLNARVREGAVWVTYPNTLIVWRR
jgi:ubiquinone/menaquinone biosynthesis C-methylase UbiE